MNRDKAGTYIDHENDGKGPIRGETPTKQAGAPRATMWVLLLSILLAVVVGGMLLSNTDEVPPSTERLEQSAPAPAPATPAAPEGVQPTTPPATTPPTNQ